MVAVLAATLHLAGVEGARGDAVIAAQARMDALSAQADDLALNGADTERRAAFAAEAADLRAMIGDLGDGPGFRAAIAAIAALEARVADMATPDGQIPPPVGLGPEERARLSALADAGRALDAAVLDLLVASKAMIAQRFWTAAIAILSMGLSMLAVAFLLLRWLDVSIVSPIRRITDTVDRIRDGDLSARAPATGLRELAALGRQVNDMAAGRARVEAEIRDALHREEDLNATLSRTKTIGQLGGWYADFAADRLRWDPQTCEIFGIDPSAAPLRPAEFFDRVDPRDRDWVANMQFHQLESGNALDFQHRILTPHGPRWVWERAEVIRDAEGAAVALDGTVQDITRLKETELELEATREAVAQSAALLRIAGRTARFGGWRYSVPDGRLECTPETAMIYELPAHTRPTVQRLMAKCHPADRDRLRQSLTDALVEGRSFNDVFRGRTATGRQIWTRITCDVVRDAEGCIIELQGACQDINDLIAARSEADRRNAELEGVVQSMQDGFIMLDDAGKVLFFNQRARDLFGPGRRMREGSDLFRGIKGRGERSMLAQLRDSVAGNENTLGLLRDPASGRVVEIAIQVLDNRRIILARDVTSERQAQRRLLLLDAALEEIDDIVLITERIEGPPEDELRVVYANEALARITGLTLDQILGRHPGSRFPDDTPAQAAALRRLEEAARRLEAVSVELFTHGPDGAQIWLQVQVVPLTDPDSGRTYLVSIERDITEEKAREERAFHSAKMEAIGQLTGGVAHDFNNLLTVILGNADMLHDMLPDDEPRRRVEAMISAAERGARLTDSMLAFSRRMPLRPAHTDVNQLIDQSLSLLRKAMPEDIEVAMALNAHNPVADIDAARLQAAIMNLVLNSRDAIDGHGHVTLSTSNIDIAPGDDGDLPLARPGAYLVIAVSDDGRGIGADVLPKVFEPFFTTKPVGAGTGLGLSTVYGFAKQSGGHVAIASEPGLGTTVRLYLPCVAQAAVLPEPPEVVQQMPVGQGEHVLVVEDDPDLLDFVMRQMTLLNYRATPARDAEAALELLGDPERDFRLLFTDVVLPGEMHGGQLAERARALRPGLKVLFTSGYTRSALDRQGRIDAEVRLISKPYRLADLANSLNEAISAE